MKHTSVAVAMSGGVDSSVAVALLLEQGYSVTGVTMRLPQVNEPDSADSPDILADAKHVADTLGISHIVVDLRDIFRERIIGDFCEEYRMGRTPNPCVICNPLIKFGLLYDHAHAAGAHYLATGHYVKKDYDAATKRYRIRAATHTVKDQSYFLYRLTQEQLARSMFPLTGLTKDEIRQKARELHLDAIAEKAESQENCFLGDWRYQDFLTESLPDDAKVPGRIVDTHGHVVGEHQGVYLYTIGQRRGLGVSCGSPRYVVAIHPDTNTVVIGENQELFTQEFLARDLHWMAIERLSASIACQVKIRYRNAATPATLLPGDHADEARVIFQEPQRAVTPGQSAVFYDDDVILGGGVIV